MFFGKLAYSSGMCRGVHKAVLGPTEIVRDMYMSRIEGRGLVRFVGPSKFATPEYRAQATGILSEIREALLPFRDRIEISTGVSDLGLDSLLASEMRPLHVSGAVGWPLPRAVATYASGFRTDISEGIEWDQAKYDYKMAEMARVFNGLSLLAEGPMPKKGITFERPGIPQLMEIPRLTIMPDHGTGFTDLERFVISGSDWGTPYETFRPLLALVVLGGGDISYREAITTITLERPVLPISEQILPYPHRAADPEKGRPEVLSASVRLGREGLKTFDAAGIAAGIIEAMNLAR